MKLDSYFGNWFMSSSEKEQRQSIYLTKMMPFGEPQKKWEEDLFNEFFSSKDIPTIKYVYLIKREMYIDEKINDEAAQKEYQKLVKNMKISKQDYDFIEYVSKRVYEAKSLEELPSIEEIKKIYEQ